jgi:predicted nucleic acid-binding Zn ribbon protein
LRDLFND